ncbi:hypothetical protein VSH64_12695 [Amycolatopsis rhabdoformis]|uniref:Uncharacterized protein n=1 Tax=Amycolatopsis rhabdoformis TaxID=1448059 RepID=A0ABZ1IGW6_9PSEU|nr:hypothetical protein [Amycolatopsis rhabdoformis]WSE32963.1 hypothetical protein VSH64_12695 [Amycolatopsis rhabdoformis]
MNPTLDRWFAEQVPDLPPTEVLTALLMASQLGHEVPDDVLDAWGREVVTSRRIVDQSEPEFITQARRRGWSWARIADRLGLPSAEAAEQRQAALEAELDRTHPQNLPGAWRA